VKRESRPGAGSAPGKALGRARFAAVVALAALVVVTPAAGAKHRSRRPRKANLTIEDVTAEGVGQPAHALVDPHGQVAGVYIRVITKNVGNAVAPPSTTEVYLDLPNAKPLEWAVRVKS
jgi:hypothetical protein